MKLRFTHLFSSLLLGSVMLHPLPAKSQEAEFHMNSRPYLGSECKATVRQLDNSFHREGVALEVDTFDVDRRFTSNGTNRAIGLSIEFRGIADSDRGRQVANRFMRADRILQTLAIGLIQTCESVQVVHFQLDGSDLSRKFAFVNNRLIEF
jgi:hypothetical protein